MKSKFSLSLMLFTCLLFSCRKQDLKPFEKDPFATEQSSNTNNGQQVAKRIYVTNTAELYAAVHNQENSGSTIVLQPNTYTLIPNPSVPTEGRLELQENMSLVGQPGNPEAVVIDVSGLDRASVTPGTGTLRTGAIRIGRGENSIEWITIQSNRTNTNLRSLIQTDLVGTPVAKIRIAHTILTGAPIGLNIINRNAECSNRIIDAVVEDSEIRDNITDAGMGSTGTGIQIQNSQGGVTGASIKVELKRNQIFGNREGLNALNAMATNCSIVIKSNNDIVEKNALGYSIEAGLTQGSIPSTNNSISFEAFGTSIRDNGTHGTVTPPIVGNRGAVFAVAGFTSAASPTPNIVNDNILEMTFSGCRFQGNEGPNADINAYGAFSRFDISKVAGLRNTTTINLNGISKTATVDATASLGFDPSNTIFVNR